MPAFRAAAQPGCPAGPQHAVAIHRSRLFRRPQSRRLFVDAFKEDALLLGPVHRVDEADWTRLRARPADCVCRRISHAGQSRRLVGGSGPADRGLFWSANLAVSRRAFQELGGFDGDMSDSTATDADFGSRVGPARTARRSGRSPGAQVGADPPGFGAAWCRRLRGQRRQPLFRGGAKLDGCGRIGARAASASL